MSKKSLVKILNIQTFNEIGVDNQGNMIYNLDIREAEIDIKKLFFSKKNLIKKDRRKKKK